MKNKNKMKIQLIKHKTGYIGISDGIPQLNYEGYFYSLYNNKIYHTSKYIITVECRSVICTTPDLELDGVPLIDLENYDFHNYKEIAKKHNGFDTLGNLYGYTLGYSDAREKYKYTEEDIRKAIDIAHSCCRRDVPFSIDLQDEIIQQINQPKEIDNIKVETTEIIPDNINYGMIGKDEPPTEIVPKTQLINGKKYLIIKKINYK